MITKRKRKKDEAILARRGRNLVGGRKHGRRHTQGGPAKSAQHHCHCTFPHIFSRVSFTQSPFLYSSIPPCNGRAAHDLSSKHMTGLKNCFGGGDFFLILANIPISFLFDKYCLIID
jgi:hypothetical protein